MTSTIQGRYASAVQRIHVVVQQPNLLKLVIDKLMQCMKPASSTDNRAVTRARLINALHLLGGAAHTESETGYEGCPSIVYWDVSKDVFGVDSSSTTSSGLQDLCRGFRDEMDDIRGELGVTDAERRATEHLDKNGNREFNIVQGIRDALTEDLMGTTLKRVA